MRSGVGTWVYMAVVIASTSACGGDGGGGSTQQPVGGTGGSSATGGETSSPGGQTMMGGASSTGGVSPGGGLGAGGASSGGAPAGTDNTTKTKGLGRPCETDADCAAPMLCRTDTQDYIGDKQCTVTCAADADCTSQFGEYSMCIGANICVTKCLTSSECPAKTTCNDSDWCIRTGPGSGEPYCAGTALPCTTLDKTQCEGALGCHYQGGCSGFATDCYSEFDSYTCTTQDGCYWSDLDSSCSGYSTPCDLISSSGLCIGQEGCTWATQQCTGTVLQTCDQLLPSICTTQPGCTVVPGSP